MTINNDFSDNRKDKRQTIHDCLQVFSLGKGQLMGNLADVSSQGIKLISLEPIKTGHYFKLEMTLTKDMLATEQLYFEAKSVWSGWGHPPNTYATGFKTKNISEANQKILTQLLKKAKSTGGHLSD